MAEHAKDSVVFPAKGRHLGYLCEARKWKVSALT